MQETKTKSKTATGIRKYVPQPDRYAERYGTFTLTARDFEIVELVYRYRHLESRHIRALIGGSDQQITRRLQGLFHNGYLARYVPRERMRLALAQGSPLIAYGLETKGRRVLEERRDELADENGDLLDPVAWKKAYSRRMEWFLEHHLMISNFRCILELAARPAEAPELWEWDQSKNVRQTVTLQDGTVHRIAPDAYFALNQGGNLRHCFLEADRSSEEQNRILHKFENYWWYLQSPGYREAHDNHKRLAVLFITTGERRMQNMMETLRKMKKPNRASHGGKGIFWFCLDSEYDLERPESILKPIWRTASNPEERYALA